MKLIYLFLILISIVSNTLGKSCKSNSECSPIESCAVGLKFIKGIGYDGYGNNVLAIGKYYDVNGNVFGLSGMFAIPVNSVNDKTIIKKFDIYGEILEGSNSTSIYSFYGYLSKFNKYYIGSSKTSSPFFSIYNQNKAQIEPIINIFNTPFVVSFDEFDNRFVFGAYGIYFINSIPTKKEDFTSATLLYQNQMANSIVFDGYNIYISTYDGKLLKGNTECKNCTQDQLQLLLTDSDISKAGSLILSNGYLYFSYENGIKGYPIDGDKSKVKQLVQETGINSITLSLDFNTLFYITNDGVVKSISTKNNNSKVKILFTSPKAINECL